MKEEEQATEVVEVDEPEECPLCLCEEHLNVTDAVIAAFLGGAASTLDQLEAPAMGQGMEQAFLLCAKHVARMRAKFTCSSVAIFDVINKRRRA